MRLFAKRSVQLPLPSGTLEPGALERQPPSELLVPKRALPSQRWIASGFVLAGFLTVAAVSVQILSEQGLALPTLVYRGFHLLGPIAYAGAAVGGFVVGRSRLARLVSAATVGFMAAQAGWERFLPSIDWTLPRLVVAGLLIASGLRLLLKSDSPSR